MLDAYIIDALKKEEEKRLKRQADEDARRPRVSVYDLPPPGYISEIIRIPLREGEEEVDPESTILHIDGANLYLS